MDDADFDRVAYYDPDYQTGWVHDPEGIAHILARRHGFVVLDAPRLAAWMKAVGRRDPSRTVCVLLQGQAPDTIAEKKSANCTARSYLDAGGRIVFIGDVPFFQIGLPGGRRKTWGDAGHLAVLGVNHGWGAEGKTEVTPAGREWGLELADAGVRCAALQEVTPLRTVKGTFRGAAAMASTWHKVFNDRHPLQGFLRYRGGSFDHVNWNAKVNELARVALRGHEEPFRAAGSWRDDALAAKERAVFSDPRYPACWSKDPQVSAARLASAHGFSPLGAEELGGWMRAQVAAGAAGSVCVLLHGIAPDTVYDDASPLCLARRYLDAGGRLVWAGDVPFLMRGRADGGHDRNNDSGTSEAVLDIPVRWDWEMPGQPTLTEAGKAWGLKTFTDEALRCADASLVTEVLAGVGPFASTWLKTYARDVPGSGFLRFRGGTFHPGMADDLAALALHALPARAAAAAEIALPEAEGERTGGGSFVVDRGRALDKLMRFMLPAPELFLQPLARAAASSGAKSLTVEASGRDLVVSFDGAPLPPEAVRDPFAAVTGESPDPRLRAWGLAVLTALRASPRAVLISSWGPAARVVSLKEIVPEPVSGAGTVFRIVRPAHRLPPVAELRAALAARAPGYAGQANPRTLTGRRAPAQLSFDDGTVRGCLRVPPAPRPTSNLLVCVQGVGAATVSFVLDAAAQVDGWVNDDRLGLNASLNGIVRDERLERVRGVVNERLGRLLRVAAARAEDLAPGRAGRLASPGMGQLWTRAVTAEPGGRFAAAFGALARAAVPDALEAELLDEAALVRWLRQSAARGLGGLEGDRGNPARAALWRAPLFTAVDGSALSLEALELARRRDGRVPVSPSRGALPADGRPVVWAPSARESDALRRHFGDAVRPVRTAAPRRAAGGLLERAGAGDVLVRVPIEGGEAGLCADAERPGIRVRGLKDGAPDAFHEAESALSIDAAVEGSAGPPAAERAAAAADRLYRALATGFSCPVAFGIPDRLSLWLKRRARQDREDVALAHLRDYLAAALAGGGPDWPRGLPLFESSAGWRSHEALAAALAEGGALLWGEKPQPGTSHSHGLDVLWGRAEGDRRMPKLFPGLERCALNRLDMVAWVKAPPRLRCAHGAPFGCLAEGTAEGTAVHLAVSPKGRVLLYPTAGGPPRGVGVAAAGRLAYEAAVAAALRTPECLLPGEHPWRGLVLGVASRWLAPWPGKPEAATLRALISARLGFQAQWGVTFLDAMPDLFRGPHPIVFTERGAIEDPARIQLSRREQAALTALWPKARELLQTVDENQRYRKALAADPGSYSEADHARARRAAKPAPPAAAVRAADLPGVMREVGEVCGAWSAAARFSLAPGAGKALVSESATGGWTADAGHPAAKAALEAPLPEGVRLAFLASSVHTAVNRLKGPVTDADDAKFQAALAAWAAEEPV